MKHEMRNRAFGGELFIERQQHPDLISLHNCIFKVVRGNDSFLFLKKAAMQQHTLKTQCKTTLVYILPP